jgi:hypothetical protein
MPSSVSVEFFDMAKETLVSHPNADPPGSARAFEQRERGWSSALFPATATQPTGQSNDNTNEQFTADETSSTQMSAVHPAVGKTAADGLFVRRSSDRRPQ